MNVDVCSSRYLLFLAPPPWTSRQGLSDYQDVYNWTRGELHISRPQHSSAHQEWSRARAAFHSLHASEFQVQLLMWWALEERWGITLPVSTRSMLLPQKCTADVSWHTVQLQEIQHSLGQKEPLCFLSALLSFVAFLCFTPWCFFTLRNWSVENIIDQLVNSKCVCEIVFSEIKVLIMVKSECIYFCICWMYFPTALYF